MSESTITADELARVLAGQDPPAVLDVRRKSDREASPHDLPGATWRDPEHVDTWAPAVRGPVVIHCVRGGSVSRSVHAALSARGVPVRYLAGGLEAWTAAGHPVLPR
jgi:rhodanese-related sulfurtransferase